MFQRQGKPAPKVDHSETDWGEFANLTKDICRYSTYIGALPSLSSELLGYGQINLNFGCYFFVFNQKTLPRVTVTTTPVPTAQGRGKRA